ncbi:MAG: histidine triad nucleotide-binding protein [Patescibacteria group bacterium]
MEDNIFYKFAKGEIRPNMVRYEDSEILAFDDINPSAPTHILILPKKPIQSVAHMEVGDAELIGRMVYRAKLLAEEAGIAENGYRLTINVGKWGGQAMPYLHIHLLGGQPLNEDIEHFSHGE